MELWKAAGVFTVLTALLTYPLSVRAGSVLLGDYPDFHLFVWTLGWIGHALARQPFGLFEANIFSPLHNSLAFSENLLGSGLIAAPVIWLTNNQILAVNVVSLLSVILCGLGAYVLARKAGLDVDAAFVCGLIFAFSPARFFRIGQLHLTAVQWMPFALAYLHTYLDHGRARDLRVAAAFFALQAITSGHGAIFLAIAMAVLIIYRLATGVPAHPVRRIKDLGVGGIALLSPAVLIAIPYQVVQREMGLRRTLENWTVAGVSYIASPSRVHQAIIGFFTPVQRVNETAHAFLFPGYLPIVLSIVAIAGVAVGGSDGGRRHVARCYALIALLSILLICGPPLSIWPLVYWLPGLNFIRVPSRFVILTVLALSVLGAVGFAYVRDRLSLRARPWALPILSALLVAEFATVPLAVTPFSVRPPAADRWLADQAKPFVVAELPNSGAPREQTAYMLHSMAHWQKTVHGYSGLDPAPHVALYAAMKTFPDAHSLEQLRAFKVTYVVIHIDRYQSDRWTEVERQLSRSGDLELLYQDSRSRVYRLRYGPATPSLPRR